MASARSAADADATGETPHEGPESNSDDWQRMLRVMPASFKAWFAEETVYLQHHVPQGARVLDVGCGEGRSIRDVLPKTKAVTGLDHDDAVTKKNIVAFADHDGLQFVTGSAHELPFEKHSFDVVVCMTTLANFADKREDALREMSRVVVPDGLVILSVYSDEAFDDRMGLYKKTSTKLAKVEGTTVWFPVDLGDELEKSEQYSREQLSDLFRSVGMPVVELKRVKARVAWLCKLKPIPIVPEG